MRVLPPFPQLTSHGDLDEVVKLSKWSVFANQL